LYFGQADAVCTRRARPRITGRSDYFLAAISARGIALPGKVTLVSSAMALRVRAPAPLRNLAGLLLLGGITLAAIGSLHRAPAPAAVQPSQPIVLNLAVQKSVVAAPAKPSIFQEEQAMPASERIGRWEPLIRQAAKRFKVPAEWIRAVMRQESGGRTMIAEDMPIVSDAGAMGVMQVMPRTYTEMAQQYGLGSDPYNARDNIFAGAAYLKWLHLKYGYPAMFAAYNDGPGNIENHLYRGRPLPDETKGYIAGIAKSLGDKLVVADLSKVTLTQPDGVKVDIDARNVSAVHVAIPGIYAPSVRAVISMGKLNRGVQEDVADVTKLLRAHGAKI
jgi:soluble lytic murein transglycosylase-like protein